MHQTDLKKFIIRLNGRVVPSSIIVALDQQEGWIDVLHPTPLSLDLQGKTEQDLTPPDEEIEIPFRRLTGTITLRPKHPMVGGQALN